MCSFIVTNKPIESLEIINRYSKLRGPDYTNSVTVDEYNIIHNLLSLTGEFTKQPFIKDNIVIVFNGEIYNYKSFGDYTTDGECIIDVYKKYGIEFTSKLDGEFAVLILDFNKNLALISTDTFATKPVWYSLEENHLSCTSYRSSTALNNFKKIVKVKANTTVVIDLNKKRVINEFYNYEFNLNQYKENYSDWVLAFENAIYKRVYHSTNQKLFLGLSSGYDSGAIACALNKLNVDFKAYTIKGSEDLNTILERKKLLKNHEIIEMSTSQYNEHLTNLKNNMEEFYDDKINYKICNDKASVGLSVICDKAKGESRKIYFSGQGVDEIISDYGMLGTKIYNHSCFGGLFPKQLESIFPWLNFYEGNQKMYISKEEHVAGMYGIETRYPFLDKDVVQEFLNLKQELKNKNYKSVLHEYLTKHDFPFLVNRKIGFQANVNLI